MSSTGFTAQLDPSGTYSIDRLRALPRPEFFETDPALIRAKLITWFETATSRKLYPAQIEMYLIEMTAYAFSLLNEEAQSAAEQNTVVFAEGKHLDVLGARVATPRLEASTAVVNLRFALSAPLSVNTVIPAGTSVSAGGANTEFLTTEALIIQSGALTGDIFAKAKLAGYGANNLIIGAINQLNAPIAFVVSVTNLTLTQGGADSESDDLYRVRLANALYKLSKAGPRAGYRELVRGVSPAIVDVAVIRPSPGVINIYPLLDSGIADVAFRAQILNALDPETLRPEGDNVYVLPPVAVTQALNFSVRTDRDPSNLASKIVSAATAALLPRRRKLGGFISPSEIIADVQAIDGVVSVSEPALMWRRLADNEFPVFTPITVSVGGLNV